MLDVVPGGRTGSDDSWGDELSSPPGDGRTVPSRTVKLTNKLPARLRRPVRQELDRQRQRRRVRDAIVRFERRPLYTDIPSSVPRHARTQRPAAPGAEQHTGDVYMQSRPNVALPVPPYAGTFMRSGSARPVRPVRPPAPACRAGVRAPRQPQAVVPKPPAQRAVRPVQTQKAPEKVRMAAPARPAVDSADNESRAAVSPAAGVVQRPRRRFALPLHFSIWPWRSREGAESGRAVSAASLPETAPRKKKLLPE